jgi:hypothetical protein
MLDLANTQGSQFGDVGRHIFGLSTVSGSSLGAVAIRAAMVMPFIRKIPINHLAKMHTTTLGLASCKVSIAMKRNLGVIAYRRYFQVISLPPYSSD